MLRATPERVMPSGSAAWAGRSSKVRATRGLATGACGAPDGMPEDAAGAIERIVRR